MAQTYLHLMFGAGARALQVAAGSRTAYARMESQAGAFDALTARELDFIAARDSFYIASVSEGGWPYLQHRGGPVGFLRHIADNRLGFVDYQGNRQYLSAANLAADDRVSVFLMDYPARRRLKLIGRARTSDDPAEIAALTSAGYDAVPERLFLIDVVGFDWNCPQHITPRFTEAEMAAVHQPLIDELARLRARISELEATRS